MTHPDDARLNDYVDGRVDPGPARELEDHLASCGRCRERAEALRALTARLADLPGEIAPRRDLRPEAPGGRPRAADGEAAGGDGAAASAPGAGRPGEAPLARRGRRAEDPDPAARPGWTWLRAAAVALALIGAGAAAWLATRSTAGPEASGRNSAVAAYAEAASELSEEVLGREDVLSPAAERALESSLAPVDGAIRELERARARGADGEALDRRLEAVYRTKLELLRGATEWMEAS